MNQPNAGESVPTLVLHDGLRADTVVDLVTHVIQVTAPYSFSFFNEFGKHVKDCVTVEFTAGDSVQVNSDILLYPLPGAPNRLDPGPDEATAGFYLGGQRIDGWFADQTTPLAEEATWALWTGYRPSEAQSKATVALLRSYREELTASSKALDGKSIWEAVVVPLINVNALPTSEGGKRMVMEVLESVMGALSAETECGRLIADQQDDKITGEMRVRDGLRVEAWVNVILPSIVRKLHGLGDVLEPKGDTQAEAFAYCLLGQEADQEVIDVINFLLILLCYHGMGNVSTFSALVSFSSNTTLVMAANALISGLSGVAHGLAGLLALLFLFALRREHTDSVSQDKLQDISRARLHANPRKPLRALGHGRQKGKTCYRNVALNRRLHELFDDDPFLGMLDRWYSGCSAELLEWADATGRDLKFAGANVDARTGAYAYLAMRKVLKSLGLESEQIEAVCGALIDSLFAGSRSKALSQVVLNGFCWDEHGTPKLIRPGSQTDEEIANKAKAKMNVRDKGRLAALSLCSE